MAALKIGVLTFHRCINYGSYWQARCLVEGLREYGHDAVLLDHYSRRVNLAEWKCALRPVLPTPVPESDYRLYSRKTRNFFRAFAALPSSPPFALENPTEMESYDLVVVGSDEVWNLRHPWYSGYSGCSLFFGDRLRAARLISYAASFGSYPASAGLEPFWADLLRNFEMISVRDENSQSIIRSALGREPELALDPCLQFLPVPQGVEPEMREPYIAVYGHNFSGWFSREVQQWARSQGYRLVSIGYRNDWADEQWITAGPDDFAHFMARAEAVATNFFHGCIFALRNEKPFVCENSSYRSIKVRDLMATVGGEQHLFSEGASPSIYNARLSEPLGTTILQRINCLRQRSKAYLDKALA